MYWCNYKKHTGLALLCSVLFCTACKPGVKESGAALKYFDLTGYLSVDTARLNHLNKLVFKTVTHNGNTQSKKVKISDWGRELSLFTASDINKPAWKNSYKVIDEYPLLLYIANDPELKMQKMVIKRDKQQIKWIVIINNTKNLLYSSTERLTYYPDSLYLIVKDQHVKLMGNNHYRIEGVIE